MTIVNGAQMARVLWVVIVLRVIGLANGLAAEPEAAPSSVVTLTVSPAAEPIPALKFRLLPPPEELVRGNAAPIYLRILWEHSAEWHHALMEEPPRLLDFPLLEMPLSEAKSVVSKLAPELEQIEAASLRSDCNWEYVIEEDPLSTPLPDAQAMRTISRLIILQSRVRLRGGDLTGAIRSLRSGMAQAQNVAKAPFLVSEIIGLSISHAMLLELDHVSSAAGSPNLYWALASLPKPLISFERGLATDRAMLLERFPELKVPGASIDWPVLANRMRDWARKVVQIESDGVIYETKVSSEKLTMARAELSRSFGFAADRVAAMSDAEVEVRYVLAQFQSTYDEWRKWYYLQGPLDLEAIEARAQRVKAEALEKELYPLASVMVPLQASPLIAQYRVSRLIARQQTIEALRMHAAETGMFPESLGEVTVVPVPHDPATGQLFDYHLDGDVGVLDVTDLAGMTRETLRLPVRVKLRSE